MFRNKIIFLAVLLLLTVQSSVFAQQNQMDEEAQKCFAFLDQTDNFHENLSQADMNILPMGIKQTIGNMGVTIAVSSAEFYQEYTSLGVFVRVKVPEQQKTFFFAAKDIKLSHDGDIIGDAKITLLKDIDIPLSGGNMTLRLKGSNDNGSLNHPDLTYVSIDCRGFKHMGLTAEVELSDALCVPVDEKNTIVPNQKVIGTFQTEIQSWEDITAVVSLPPFMIKGLDDFIWRIKNAIFDFSDLRNPSQVRFPQRYDQYLIPGNQALWRGVYISDLDVTLPAQFAKQGDTRTTFSAHDMIIDDNGITGTFGVETSILSLNEGDASGWAFSVDYFGITLMANTLEGVEFGGEIGLPVSESSTLRYDGLIAADNKYMLKVQTVDSLAFEFLNATAELDPNSYVEFKLDNGKFRPEARLHGRMGVRVAMDDGVGKELAQFKGIEFRSLHLKTENPYLTVEYFGYQGEVSFMNFPLSISNIGLTANGTEAALGFDACLNLGDSFKGETSLAIVGTLQDGAMHKWKFKKVDIGRIFLETEIAETFTIKGALDIMNDDPTYGNGFMGELAVEFKGGGIAGIELKARAAFGRTDFRYWFVEGTAEIGLGIPVMPPLSITGFGGGITYKMKPTTMNAKGQMVYVPSEKSSMGVKASALFTVVKKEVINGEVSFELSFNNKGGLDYAGFYGIARFAGAIPGLDKLQNNMLAQYGKLIAKEQEFAGNNSDLADKLKRMKQYSPNEAAKTTGDDERVKNAGGLTAAVGIQYNFSEASLHATFELYVNMLGGFMRGAGTNNRAGYAVFHIDPKQWYVHMGTPTDRIGLKVGVGNINVETGSYFMTGTNIPAAPGVPTQVAALLGEDPTNLNYMNNLNALGDGRGFAFGNSFNIATGDLTFLILYANYSMGLGFDIMLKDYGDAQCKGRSGAIGMDGWYANGQAYAYMHGELGVKVNLWFMKAKLPIISADVAALMQAMLPNPTYFKAYLAARAKLLGGLVNVNCKFKIAIGEECELVIPGSSPLEMAMISDLSPTDNSNDISVFTAPQAAFNMAIGKAFDVQDDEGEKTFRIQLKDFTLNNAGTTVPGQLKWNATNDAVSFYSHEILPDQQTVTATVRVVFEELKSGRWSPVYTSGKEAVEEKTVSFITSAAPAEIPLENVVYCYPVVDQQYFLKNETEKGYVQLRFGQKYLFPADMKSQIIYEDERGNKQTVDFTYNESQKRIDYALPQLNNTVSYQLKVSLLNQDTQSTQAGTAVSSQLLNDSESGQIDVQEKTASSETRTDLGATLLSYHFATSAYNTLKEKVDNITKTDAVVRKISSDVLMFKYETRDMEPFDLADLTGTLQTGEKPLLLVSAALDDYYYREKIYPLLYQDYPVDGRFTVSRDDAQSIGVPPAGALPVISEYLSNIENNNYTGISKSLFPYYYNLPQYYRRDLSDLQNQVVNAYLNGSGSSKAYNKLATATFPFISSGNYNINVTYQLPDGKTGTSTTFTYYNFIK